MSLPYLVNPAYGFGSRILTFTNGNANGVSFIANEYDPNEPTADTRRTTELGAPNGFILFEERRLMRAQLQYATNVTNVPSRGDTMTITRRTTNTNVMNVNYAVTEVGNPERPRDFWVCDVQAMETI